MNFYKVGKSRLTWKEMVQVNYPWKLPILIDTDLNVVLGNSLKDSLPDSIIVVQMDNNQREFLIQELTDIEEKVAEENSNERIVLIEAQLREFFKRVRSQKFKWEPLFQYKETACITPETYIEPPEYNFNKHNNREELMYNAGRYLSEELSELMKPEENGKVKEMPPEIEIDLEIMKELL